MSKASAVGGIVFNPKSRTYQPSLQCDKGDLYQEYDGDVSNPTNITPDFTSLKPTLSYVLLSSLAAEGVVVPSAMKWYFNGTLLTFSSNVSTNTFSGESGHFRFVPYVAGTTLYYGLQVVKNLVKASGAAACVIQAVATVSIGNVTEEVQNTYTIPITKGVGLSTRVTITSGDNKFFTITEKGGSCLLKAYTQIGSEEVTANLTYKWYKMINGAWSLLSNTAQSLTVQETEVDGSAIYRVEVYQNGTLIGGDTQTVMDATDPFDLILNPYPEDMTIVEDGDTVTFTPILVQRGSSTKYMDMTFFFTFMDSAGNVLNPSTCNVAAASGTITYAMCIQAGCGPNFYIETTQ